MSPPNDHIVFIPLASSLHDRESVGEVVSRYRNWLEGYFDYEIDPVSRIRIKEGLGLKAAAGVLALVVTGGTERLIRSVIDFGRPTIVLTHESMNSLPAVLEALPSIDDSNRPQLLLARNRGELDKVEWFVKAAKTFARIKRYRLGLIGGRSPWLTYSLPDGEQLSKRLGIRLIAITMDEFKREYESASKPLVTKLAIEARSKASSAEQIKLKDFRKSSSIYVAIKKIAEKHNLTAVSLRCFDLIDDYKATGCYAVARMNDESFVAGCEGDIPATAAMILLTEVSGSPSFLANASFVKGHRLVLAHCTIAPRLTAKHHYRTHFESGLGISVAGSLRKGERVTIARFDKTLSRLRAGEGVAVRCDAWSENLCRTQAEIRMDGDAELIKDQPLGNHYVLTYGEHVSMLRTLMSFAGIELEEI